MIPRKHFLRTSSIAVNVLHVSPEAHSTTELSSNTPSLIIFLLILSRFQFPFSPPSHRKVFPGSLIGIFVFGLALNELVPVDLRCRTCLF
jgi:hypothetical protein